MESPQEPLKFISRVIAIEEKFRDKWIGGVGEEAKFESLSQGWFIGLEGSYEYIYAGTTRPNIKVGDIATIRITF